MRHKTIHESWQQKCDTRGYMGITARWEGSLVERRHCCQKGDSYSQISSSTELLQQLSNIPNTAIEITAQKLLLGDFLHMVPLGKKFKTENQNQTNDFNQLNNSTMCSSPCKLLARVWSIHTRVYDLSSLLSLRKVELFYFCPELRCIFTWVSWLKQPF